MPAGEDVCTCFHVSDATLRNFCKTKKPRVASQLSQCNGVGTGCGSCVPKLKQIFEDEKQ